MSQPGVFRHAAVCDGATHRQRVRLSYRQNRWRTGIEPEYGAIIVRMLTMCPRCGAPVGRHDAQCMNCYQPTTASTSDHAPRGIWTLVLDAFRHHNGGGRTRFAGEPDLDNGSGDEPVTVVELDRVRARKAQKPPAT
jgi:hypothetical protein